MSATVTRSIARPLLVRGAAYFLFWVVLAGIGWKDMAAGALTAAMAAWISLRLLPAGELAVKPGRAFLLFLRFLRQSVIAGVTVGRIAFSPVMALRPGMVNYRTALPPGQRRFLFMTYASLLPGTLPTGTAGSDVIAVHALDCRLPVAKQLAEEEERLTAVMADGAP